jgi:L-malate glycosyltransferase
LHLHGYRAVVTAAIAGIHRRVAMVKTEHSRPEYDGGLTGRARAHLNQALDVWATRYLRPQICYVTKDLMHRSRRAHAGLHRRVLPNGIAPLNRSGRPRPPGLDLGPFHVGIVGRVSKVKGIQFALKAWASGVIPSHVCLDIIGTGPLQEALGRQVAELGLCDRVHFHGFQRDVLDWIAHLDILLIPSLHEGLPYTLLEAMSLGVTAIVSRVGGLAEVLCHRETGLLVDRGDADEIAAAVAGLVGNPEMWRRLGAAGAREQREHYTLEKMVDEYRQVYAMAMAGLESHAGLAGNRER